jgi:hypothetical protein
MVTKTFNRLNRKKAASVKLNAIVVDEDFKEVKNPLPMDTPNFIKAMTAPNIRYPEGMAEDEAFTKSNLEIETMLRSLQATVLTGMKASTIAEVAFYEAELAGIRGTAFSHGGPAGINTPSSRRARRGVLIPAEQLVYI